MKNYLTGAFLLFATSVSGQSAVEKTLQQVVTLEDAQQFVTDHAPLKPALHFLNSQSDTSALDRQLYKGKKGAVIKTRGFCFKIIQDTVKYALRASYIYLDGSALPGPAIDSIRALIMKRYARGVAFAKLADEYTMDHNPRHGDLGFFDPGSMVKEFGQAVRDHAKGEVFLVDVPSNKWYYVVKKTAADRVTREMTVLQVKL